jgi:carbon-monoxide dehydrogenase small subunit
MSEIFIRFKLNSNMVQCVTDPYESLLNILRKKFHLTGTKCSCEEGDCGACTVLLNRKAVVSCLVLGGNLDGCTVTTIEGLEDSKGKLHHIQQAFIDEGAIQCGFCTPGLIMSAFALLLENPNPSDDDIRIALAGNLCRCTGYKSIIRAIHKSADVIRNSKEENFN